MILAFRHGGLQWDKTLRLPVWYILDIKTMLWNIRAIFVDILGPKNGGLFMAPIIASLNQLFTDSQLKLKQWIYSG